MTTLKTKQEIVDFVRGCTFLGTGGGGSPEPGIEGLTSLLEKGKTLSFIPASEISDDA